MFKKNVPNNAVGHESNRTTLYSELFLCETKLEKVYFFYSIKRFLPTFLFYSSEQLCVSYNIKERTFSKHFPLNSLEMGRSFSYTFRRAKTNVFEILLKQLFETTKASLHYLKPTSLFLMPLFNSSRK